MPSRSDAINAMLTLKELSDTEQRFLDHFIESNTGFANSELLSHLRVTREILGAQTVLLSLIMENAMHIDDRIHEILEKL